MAVDIRVGGPDQRRKFRVGTGDDQLLQVDGAAEHTVLVGDEEGRDVVVLRRLLDQGAHGLLHREVRLDRNVVRGHFAANLILIEGRHQRKFFLGGLIHALDEIASLLPVQMGEDLQGGVGLHVLHRLGCLAQVHLDQVSVGLCALHALQDVGEHIRLQNAVQLFPLGRGQGRKDLRNVFFMVVLQTLPHHAGRDGTADDGDDLAGVVGLGGDHALHRSVQILLHVQRLLFHVLRSWDRKRKQAPGACQQSRTAPEQTGLLYSAALRGRRAPVSDPMLLLRL